jgi:hypothetical protein
MNITAHAQRAPGKRLPAYAKQIMQELIAGRGPRGLYVVLTWDLAKAFPRIVILDDLPLADIDLRCVAGLDITLAYRSKDASRMPDLSAAILNANPRILNALAVDIPQHFILKYPEGVTL